MAEIFKAPSAVALPETDWSNYNQETYEANENKYLAELVSYINDMGYKGKNVGEVLRIPECDGHAQYMVMSMKPVRLIHLELGDAWGSQFAELLTAKKVNEMLNADKKMKELFG